MNSIKSTFVQIIKRKESLLYLLLFIAGLSLLGWFSGKMGLATFSLKYIPIAPSSALIFIILCILLISHINFEKSRFGKFVALTIILLVALFCLLIFLNYLFNFKWDIENIFISHPAKLGTVSIGRMSPITAWLFNFICIGLISIKNNDSDLIRYTGGSFSLLVGLLSLVLLIGYLYKAPLLYGSQIIPVSLPSAISFFFFSITLLRIFEIRFWTFNLIKGNKVTYQLLKSFLPIVVFIVILQGLLITNFPLEHKNPTLSAALVLLIVIVIIATVIIRVSVDIGAQLQRAELAIKNNEEKLKFYTDNSPLAVVEWDSHFTVTQWTGDSEKIFGWNSEEVVGKKIMDLNLIYEPDIPVVQKTMEKLTSGLFKQVLSTNRNYRKDGSIITCEWYNTILQNQDGEMLSVLSQVLDITERKLAETNLEESYEFNSQIINSLEEGVIVYDHNLRYKVWNHFMEELSGMPASQVLGKYPTEVFPFLEEVGVLNNLKRTLLNGENIGATDFPFHIPLSGKSGWSSDKNMPFRNVEGEIIGVLGTVHDITERKKSEESLKSINERFVLATAAASISVWEHDFITDMIQMDDNFNMIYGTTHGNYQIEFEEFIKFIHPDDVDIIKTNIEEGIKSDENMDFEFRIIRPDGNIRNISAYGKIVKDKTNKPIKFIGVNIDISDFRNAELTIKENERKLLQLNTDKDRFISILGHDLRSPFNNLLGLSEVLTEDSPKLKIDEIVAIAKNINNVAQNSYNLLEDLLMWAKTQQGKIPFKPQLLSFTDICRNILEILNPNAEAKNIAIKCITADHIYILADADMLKMVLRNLVSNAIKFTNKNGTINISATQTDSNVTISVSDNGIGIEPDDLTKLFDISQVFTTKGTAGETGTGLGLLLCKDFVEKNGGKIWVESKEGKGSEFKFTLPIFTEQTAS